MRQFVMVRTLAMFLALVGIASVGESIGVRTGALGTAQAQARFVADRPYSGGRRPIELNLRMNAYYGYGWYDSIDSFRRGYGYYGGYAVGPGIQMLFPVVKNGFIPSINNAFYVGFFTDFMFHPYGGDYFFSFAVGPMVQWRFFLLDMFQSGSLSVFGNLGFGIWPWFFSDRYRYCPGCGTMVAGFPLFQVGANLFFTRNIGLTVAFGYPSTNFGVTFGF